MTSALSIRLFCIATIGSTVVACAANPASDALTRAASFGGALFADDYKRANLVGVVQTTEGHVESYPRLLRGPLYNQGVRYDTPETRYRVVTIGIRESDNLRHMFLTGAAVPDALPLLRPGDIVEFRNTAMLDNLENFAQTKSGNIVLSVLCWREDPQFEQCAQTRAPWKGWGSRASVSGVSPNPYRDDVSSYGFTFTARYDDSGNVLASAPQPPERPFAGLPDHHPRISPPAHRKSRWSSTEDK